MSKARSSRHAETVAALAASMRHAAFTGVVASPPERPSISPPDATLVRCCAELATNNATRIRLLEQHVRASRTASAPAREALSSEIRRTAAAWRLLVERIGDTPATTLAGCHAKARAVRTLFDQSPEPRTARMDVAASLAADLLALANDGAR